MRRVVWFLAKIVGLIGIVVAGAVYGAPVLYAALLVGAVVLVVVIAADAFVFIRLRRWRSRRQSLR